MTRRRRDLARHRPHIGAGEGQAGIGQGEQRQADPGRFHKGREPDAGGDRHTSDQTGLARRGVRPAQLEQPVRGIAAHPIAHHRHDRGQRPPSPQRGQREAPRLQQIRRKPGNEEVDREIQAEQPDHQPPDRTIPKQVQPGDLRRRHRRPRPLGQQCVNFPGRDGAVFLRVAIDEPPGQRP